MLLPLRTWRAREVMRAPAFHELLAGIRPGIAIAIAVLGVASVGFAQTAPRVGEVSLDSLLNTHISVAAKYLQTSAEAAASVTILSSEDIRQQGYTNLLEVLESVPGLYVSNDRNYPYLGTRGFGRPSDYNNRVLLLIDGHTLNEQVWGSAPVGSDFPINLDAVERVEVVRGPGSALYGNSAMFAVINIVTRGGTHANGGVASVRLGSGLDRQASATLGYPIGARSSFAISALSRSSDGRSVAYPEYQSSSNPLGMARHSDWENGNSVLATLAVGTVTTRVGFRSRTKGVPTGSFGTAFNDPGNRTRDETLWGDVSVHGTVGPTIGTTLRFYADRGTYSGRLVYDSGRTYADRSLSADLGADGLLVWDTNSRNRLSLGAELRGIFAAEYFGRSVDGRTSGGGAPFALTSLFAQDELQLRPGIRLVGGLRFDRKLMHWQALTPRVAIIATPAKRSTIKLLYGEAYRGPSVAESDLDGDFYTPNSSLRAERIATSEVAVEQRVWSSFLLDASAYSYAMRNLIEQVTADTISGVLFTNAQSTRGRGLEVSMNYQPATSPVALRWWYATQRTRDNVTRLQLTNSPQRILNAATLLRGGHGTHAAFTVHRETGRQTINGGSTPVFTRFDLNVGYAPPSTTHWHWMRGTDFSLRTSNVFNTRYAYPGGLQHLQQSIQQDGRAMALRVRREF